MSINKTDDLSFFQHLVELRDKLLKSVLAITAVFICLFPFANDIYTFVAQPLIDSIPDNGGLISIGVISPFLTPLKMALTFALYISMPFIIYQIWTFVAPALYNKEKRFMIPLIISTGLLFYSGVIFAFYVVFPVIFSFLANIGPSVVNFTPDIQFYLDFALKVSFAFGVAFEVPVATVLFVKFGIATVEGLRKNRPFIIIGTFVVGMILTPPDIISQTMIAIPMWLLFELGLIIATKIETVKTDEASDESRVEPQKNNKETKGSMPESVLDVGEDSGIDWDDDENFNDDDFDDIPDWDGELEKK